MSPMTHNFTIVFLSSYCFQFFIFFWISAAHEKQAHFVRSSVVTSQKQNLKMKIREVVQFFMNIFKLHNFKELFGNFEF